METELVDAAVSLRNVTKEYSSNGQTVKALSNLTLDVVSGEFLSIMGPSGSGKSTLFNMIGGLDRPTRGEVLVHGIGLAGLSAAELALLRCRKIGFVFQTFNLVPAMTALENCMLPMLFGGMSRRDAASKSASLLDSLMLGSRLRHRTPELSGGQQQRVAIARALANDPELILADEPTGNLDSATGRETIELLRVINSSRRVTVIAATHDLAMLEASDRIVHIRDGQIDRMETRAPSTPP